MATADEAIAAVSRGEIVIVCDDEDRENECDFIAAGWLLTEDDMAQFIRATTGIICAVMSAERAHILGLPLQAQLLAAAGMAPADGPFASTGFTVSVDSTAVTTGVSAMERLRTIQALGDAAIKPTQLRRGTGHVFPLIARAGGLRERRGHTEAAYMLATAAAERVAYTGPVIGVLAELRARNGHGMMRRDKAAKVAAKHKLVMTTVEALAQWQAAQDKARIKPARPLASCVLPLTLADGTVSEGWEMHCFASDSADPHRALVLGKAALVAAVAAQTPAILVRVHSDCWWGDVLGSARCDCGVQLRLAQARIHAAGCGILIFPAGHEGRGIGLVHKTRAYATTTLAAEAAAERLGEEEQGLTTYEANVAIGQPADARDYACVVPILRALGLGDSSVHLLTGNPAKVAALGSLVACVEALVVPPTTHSAAYLQQKAAWHANGSVLPAAEGKTEEEKKQ
jgi:3,4-dihydroxy 2-butanone 4-phosphate synthase/GTP cyclohydrolase II